MASQTLRTRAPRAVTPEQKVEHRRASFAGAAQLDVGPPLEEADRPRDVHETIAAFSGDDVFRWNAGLILEATRRVASDEVGAS